MWVDEEEKEQKVFEFDDPKESFLTAHVWEDGFHQAAREEEIARRWIGLEEAEWRGAQLAIALEDSEEALPRGEYRIRKSGGGYYLDPKFPEDTPMVVVPEPSAVGLLVSFGIAVLMRRHRTCRG